MTITMTLPLDVPVRPIDAKGLKSNVLNSKAKLINHLQYAAIQEKKNPNIPMN